MSNPYSADPHTMWELAKVMGLSARWARATAAGKHGEARRLEERIDRIREEAEKREARRG